MDISGQKLGKIVQGKWLNKLSQNFLEEVEADFYLFILNQSHWSIPRFKGKKKNGCFPRKKQTTNNFFETVRIPHQTPHLLWNHWSSWTENSTKWEFPPQVPKTISTDLNVFDLPHSFFDSNWVQLQVGRLENNSFFLSWIVGMRFWFLQSIKQKKNEKNKPISFQIVQYPKLGGIVF